MVLFGMKFPALRLFAVALSLGLAACSPSREDKPPQPKVIAPGSLPKLGAAPAWQLRDVQGNVVSSEQFKGQVVVVDFWATWCGPCVAEIPGFIELQRKYGKDGFTFVGISLDEAGVETVQSFVAKHGVNYPIVMATEAVQGAFGGLRVIPTTLLIDRDGQIRDRKEGAEETASYEAKIVSLLQEKA
jgi:thiol-disulfide isomerase/thioredoxin